MRNSSTLTICALVLVSAACSSSPSRAQRAASSDSTEAVAARVADAEMSGMAMDMDRDPHMHMSARRVATAADSARAAALAIQIRTALAKYRDVRVAIADGFKQFLPNVPQPIYHFTNYRSAIEEAFRFDPAKPTSLLYRKNPDGSYSLVGAMYTAPDRRSEDELNRRIPLGIARWHQHVNWCMPKSGEQARWAETRDGKPVFGPKSPIATEAACEAVGGVFHDHVFGWMVHANVFASDDPRVIWGEEM